MEGFDRAAPQGVGGVKVAGNYAADILPNTLNKQKGYPISLYLDSKTQSYIEEFSTSNFFGVKDDGKTYVTPESAAVLPSITNKSLMALATAAGLTVEQRAVPVDELNEFTEVIEIHSPINPMYTVLYVQFVVRSTELSLCENFCESL